MNPGDTLAAPMASPDTQQEVLVRALRVGLRIALGVLGDREAAAEVAQEVAIVALRRHGSLRDPRALDAWLYRTAVRAALREAERSRTRRAAERAAAVSEHAPDAAAIAAAQLLAELPPRQRAALTLRYVHDLDDHAIATALGCRPGTVRSLLSRGLSTLREQADPDDRMIS
ncbi:MAG TPA: sigma-70 family RNA polymerase sigma factor [Solirubrobacteraceae bacterium]|nr:sigma-70 family RNA polymerase sigma factor [Solirubrobacteraceae bacterium]